MKIVTRHWQQGNSYYDEKEKGNMYMADHLWDITGAPMKAGQRTNLAALKS